MVPDFAVIRSALFSSFIQLTRMFPVFIRLMEIASE